MDKKLLNLKRLEEKQVIKELTKIDKAEKSFRNYSFFNSLSIMFFVMSVIMVITACFYKKMLVGIDDSLISLIVLSFVVLSIISLLISSFYNSRTIYLAKEYYKKTR